MHKKIIRCSLYLNAKIGVYIIGLKAKSNKSNWCVHYPVYFNKFLNNENLCVQYEAKSRNLHDCKFMIQEMCELYDVTLLVIVFFKSYVMNFVDFVIDFYSHIISHVSKAFASCKHYISYSLLNIIHVFVCVFRSDQPSLHIL